MESRCNKLTNQYENQHYRLIGCNNLKCAHWQGSANSRLSDDKKLCRGESPDQQTGPVATTVAVSLVNQ